jgi:hypothetical protein
LPLFFNTLVAVMEWRPYDHQNNYLRPYMKKILTLILLVVSSLANADEFPFNNITYSSDCKGDGGTNRLTFFQKGNVLHLNGLEYDTFSVQEGGGGMKMVTASNASERTKVIFFIDKNTYQLSEYEDNGKLITHLSKYTSNGTVAPIYKNCSPDSPIAATQTPAQKAPESIPLKKQVAAPIQQPVKTKVSCEESDVQASWIETSSSGMIRDPVSGDIDFAPANWKHIDRTPAELEAIKTCLAEKQAISRKNFQKNTEIQIKENSAVCKGHPKVSQNLIEEISKDRRVNPNSISLNRVENQTTYCLGIFYMPTGSMKCNLMFDKNSVITRVWGCN